VYRFTQGTLLDAVVVHLVQDEPGSALGAAIHFHVALLAVRVALPADVLVLGERGHPTFRTVW